MGTRPLIIIATLCALAWCNFVPLVVPRTERIQIHDDHVTWLHVGNPGKWLRFRIRMDTPDIYLFQHPMPYSRSWASLSGIDENEQPKVRDTLLIGNTQFRADFVVGRFPGETSPTVEGAQAEGVLGISAQSPLWKVWRNFTKTRDYLYFGQVLTRLTPGFPSSLQSSIAPTWIYGADIPSRRSFTTVFSAHLAESSRIALQNDCEARLKPDGRQYVTDLSEIGDIVAAMFGQRHAKQICTVGSEYTVIIEPESDYNVIPQELTMHNSGHTPMFTMTDGTNSFRIALFDIVDDAYIDIDTTNAAGSGVEKKANLWRVGLNNTIILGAFALRRFEFAVMLDTGVATLSVRHTGLVSANHHKSADSSIELHRMRDINVLIAGLLLWALISADPDLAYVHDTPPNPPARASGPGVSLIGDAIDAPPSQEHVLFIKRRAVITARMISSWPIKYTTLMCSHATIEAAAIMYFVIAVGFYETPWALSTVFSDDATSNALGWTTLAFVFVTFAALSWVGAMLTGRDARLCSLVSQTQILLALSTLMISLFQWDVALIMMLLLSLILGIVVSLAALHVFIVNPLPRIQLIFLAILVSWIVYSSLALYPFMLERLWDSQTYASMISFFLTLSIVIPAALYLTISALAYPAVTKNVALESLAGSMKKAEN